MSTDRFGSSEARRKAVSGINPLTALLLFILTVTVTLLLFGERPATVSLERGRPVVEVVSLPNGIGQEPVTLSVRATDPGSGLSVAVVRLVQNDAAHELLSKSFPSEPVTSEEILSVTIDGMELNLSEGESKVLITVRDNALFKNGRTVTVPLMVDYHKPELTALVTQDVERVGATGGVVYRAQDLRLVFNGVKSGTELFAGFPVSLVDPEFKDASLYFALFVPGTQKAPMLFAKDAVGNIASLPFGETPRSRAGGFRAIRVSERFLQLRARKMYAEWEKLIPGAAAPSAQDLRGRFHALDVRFRRDINERLSALFNTPRRKKLYNGRFLNYGQPEYDYGDELSFLVGDATASENPELRVSRGAFYAENSGTKVRSGNAGSVIFSGHLGPYGKVVIVDHGLGVSSLYGHLSSLSVSEGDSILKGEVIGVAGNSGLDPRTGFYFEIRIHGLPAESHLWQQTDPLEELFAKEEMRQIAKNE